jgi:hypothetical protein
MTDPFAQLQDASNALHALASERVNLQAADAHLAEGDKVLADLAVELTTAIARVGAMAVAS